MPDTKTTLQIAFDKYANAGIILVTLFALTSFLPFYLALVSFISLVIFFVVGVSPTARRNKAAWDSYFPRQHAEKVHLVDHKSWLDWKRPLLIVVHAEKSFGVSTLGHFNHEAFDNACVCVSLPHRVFPLARYVLWNLGGILPASRSVLLRLLGRRPNPGSPGASTIAPPSVVVVYYDGKKISKTIEQENGSDESKKTVVSAQLDSKSVISAVLKTDAAISSAVQMADGSIYIGQPFHLQANVKAGSGVETPSLDDMLGSSEEYCVHLEKTMKKAYGPNTVVHAKR